jgi:hypothetical protein
MIFNELRDIVVVVANADADGEISLGRPVSYQRNVLVVIVDGACKLKRTKKNSNACYSNKDRHPQFLELAVK